MNRCGESCSGNQCARASGLFSHISMGFRFGMMPKFASGMFCAGYRRRKPVLATLMVATAFLTYPDAGRIVVANNYPRHSRGNIHGDGHRQVRKPEPPHRPHSHRAIGVRRVEKG